MAPATASHGGGAAVSSHGGCGGPAVWRLKAKPSNNRIELEAEVDSNHVGQVWDWTIRHNGSTAAKGSSTTHGVSGSFTVQRRLPPTGVNTGRQVAPPVTSPGHLWHFQGVATAGKRGNRRFTGDPYDDRSSSATAALS